jgi:hypothetical protein
MFRHSLPVAVLVSLCAVSAPPELWHWVVQEADFYGVVIATPSLQERPSGERQLVGTRCFSSSNQFSATPICGAAVSSARPVFSWGTVGHRARRRIVA